MKKIHAFITENNELNKLAEFQILSICSIYILYICAHAARKRIHLHYVYN